MIFGTIKLLCSNTYTRKKPQTHLVIKNHYMDLFPNINRSLSIFNLETSIEDIQENIICTPQGYQVLLYNVFLV